MDEQKSTTKSLCRLKWKKAFLACLSQTGNVTQSAATAKIDRLAVYRARTNYPDFALDWDDALQKAMDVLEQEARRRAYDGLLKKKFNGKGEPLVDTETGQQYAEREYSDTLLIFLLKGGRPEKYKDKLAIGGDKDAPPIQTKNETELRLTDVELCARFFELLDSQAALGKVAPNPIRDESQDGAIPDSPR